jgi:hypothetical protein
MHKDFHIIKSPVGLLKNAHTLKGTMVCGVALQTAPLNVYPYTPRGSVFAPLKRDSSTNEFQFTA